ncbi:hypothetical protein [Geosporobacter ferrireducens]|nr:hypothetical protein [Geosporobacter ferrireducens]
MQDFSGKVVLVTGGGQGIGMAISRFYAQAGTHLVIDGGMTVKMIYEP